MSRKIIIGVVHFIVIFTVSYLISGSYLLGSVVALASLAINPCLGRAVSCSGANSSFSDGSKGKSVNNQFLDHYCIF